MRHPNYVAVIGELVAVALLSGALIAGPLGIVAFSALIARRVAVEERALNAILRR
jgi:isoprenylcysteine carboxyl methyltransferase (ICMT) family protein YpbQ